MGYLKSFETTKFNFPPELLKDVKKYPPIIAYFHIRRWLQVYVYCHWSDSRNDSLGLFESLTYISGLSGGSWVLLDLILHEFDPNNLLKYWDFETSILEDIPDFNMITEDINNKVNINKN